MRALCTRPLLGLLKAFLDYRINVRFGSTRSKIILRFLRVKGLNAQIRIKHFARKIIKPTGKLVKVLKAQQWPDTKHTHYLLYIKQIYNL